MTFAPVGNKCPEHAGVGGVRRPAQRAMQPTRHARSTISGLEAPATVGLIALNVLVYLVTIYQGGGGISEPGGELFGKGALIGAQIYAQDEWYRLVTAMFLHGSLLHIALNMIVLYWCGTIVERALGTWRFLLIYFVSGIAGSAGALLFSGPFAVTVGASGAIYGIFGALLILEYRATGTFAGPALGLIVINLALSFVIPNISWGGHVGGLVGGTLATFALLHFQYTRPRSLGPVLVGLIMVVSIVVAYVRVESYV
jgi:membrane associated rhomboid family serine protease